MSADRTPSQQGRASRSKGQAGERQIAALLTQLTGRPIKRRVRNHQGDNDLTGLEPWAIECKCYATATPAVIAGWWVQACQQAAQAGGVPLLVYRLDRQPWRCVWHAGHHHTDNVGGPLPSNILDTLTGDPLTWWRMVRKLDPHELARRTL